MTVLVGGSHPLPHPMVGDKPPPDAVDRFDLRPVRALREPARATGQDERLDPHIRAALLAGGRAGSSPGHRVLR